MNLASSLDVQQAAAHPILPRVTAALPFGRVQRVDPLNHPGWDEAVANLDGVTSFHTAGWARVLHESYGHHPVYFAVFEQGQLLAALPVMEVNSWVTGRRGVSLPFTDACEPLGDRSLLRDAIKPQLMQHGRQRAWKFIECRGGRELFGDGPAFQSFYTHELRLFPDVQFLFAHLDSPTRRAIRKAEKQGVTVELSRSLDATREYYSLHCRTRQKHGQPPQSFNFFRKIHEYLLAHNNGTIALARHAGQIVAGAVYFHFGRQVIYKFGASDVTCQELRANNLVMWEAIKHYASQGMTGLNFGRTSLSNEGLRRFKLGWGATEHKVDYTRYDLRLDVFQTGRDRANGWHTHVFRRLPQFVSRWLGAALYRHVT